MLDSPNLLTLALIYDWICFNWTEILICQNLGLSVRHFYLSIMLANNFLSICFRPKSPLSSKQFCKHFIVPVWKTSSIKALTSTNTNQYLLQLAMTDWKQLSLSCSKFVFGFDIYSSFSAVGVYFYSSFFLFFDQNIFFL